MALAGSLHRRAVSNHHAGKQSALKGARSVWKGGKTVKSYLSLPYIRKPGYTACKLVRCAREGGGQMTRQAVQTGDHAHGRTYTRRKVLYSAVRSGIGVAIASVVGVWTHAPSVAGATSSVTVGYSKAGLTCEGATFAAQAQGYFRDEGLDLTTLALPGPGELAS